MLACTSEYVASLVVIQLTTSNIVRLADICPSGRLTSTIMGYDTAIWRALENAAFVVPEFESAESRYDLLVNLKE
jgi:hypothetical protein